MDAPSLESSQSLKWYEVWREVFFHPSEQTFHRILADPMAKPGRAFLWVAVLGVISGIVQAFSSRGLETGQTSPLFTSISIVLCIPLGAVIALALSTLITHWIAGLFGGNGAYDRLVYAFGSVQAPSTLVSIILTSIGTLGGLGLNPQGFGSPLLICLAPFSLAWGIYIFFLQVLGLKAVEGITTGKAILTLLMPLILVLIVGGLCLALVLVPIIVRSYQ